MANNDVVDAMGAEDARTAASMPKPTIPEGYSADDFHMPDLPVVPFSLRSLGSGSEFGPFAPEGWMTDPETGITSTHDDNHHLFVLRVLAESRNGNVHMLHVIDEAGKPDSYIVYEIPDNTLEDPDLPAPVPTHQDEEF